MVSLIGPFVVPINKMQMKPRFVMAALIIRSQAKSFPKDGEGTMFVHSTKVLRTRGIVVSQGTGSHCSEIPFVPGMQSLESVLW